LKMFFDVKLNVEDAFWEMHHKKEFFNSIMCSKYIIHT
jgi:hypothetical protein